MIFKLLFAIVPIGLILLSSEFLWQMKIIKGERARKFIHILAGVWMAFWPFYISFDSIFLLGTAALTLLMYSRLTNLFHAIYAVKRKTYGELFFAVGIMTCAYIGKEPWIYTSSILLLALADGGAAVVGRLWGVSNQYKVFDSKQLVKSVAGTSAFLAFALLSIAIGLVLGGHEVLQGNYAVFIILPLVLTLVENVSPYGVDNILTPVIATIVLNSLL